MWVLCIEVRHKLRSRWCPIRAACAALEGEYEVVSSTAYCGIHSQSRRHGSTHDLWHQSDAAWLREGGVFRRRWPEDRGQLRPLHAPLASSLSWLIRQAASIHAFFSNHTQPDVACPDLYRVSWPKWYCATDTDNRCAKWYYRPYSKRSCATTAYRHEYDLFPHLRPL